MTRKIILKGNSSYINRPNNIGEIKMGNVFKDISNSTIISESEVKECFNKLSDKGDNLLANALLEVLEKIEDSKDPEAEALFNSFITELTKQDANKTVLKTLWEGIIRQLPHIGTMATVIEKITKMLSSGN